jgi:uridine phosphorylase
MQDSTNAAAGVAEPARLYHLGLLPGEFPGYVITCAHPERIPKVAAHFDTIDTFDPVPKVKGGYVLRKGVYRGLEIGTVNSGMYGSSSVCLEELARLECHTVIRSGTCATLRADINCGDVIINTGAMRMEGATDYYVAPSYPAVANPELVMALIEAADRLGIRYHVGIGASTAGFYVPQARPGPNGYLPPSSKTLIADLQEIGVLDFEGQASSHFVLGTLFGFRAGAVLSVVANRVTGEFGGWDLEEQAVRVSLEAATILARWDECKRRSGKPYFFPSLLSQQLETEPTAAKQQG